MPWTTDEQIQAAIKAALGEDPDAELPAQWIEVAASANKAAYGRIRALMRVRGYTATQLEVWDERASYNRRGALCLAFTDAASTRDIKVGVLERMCSVWDELKDPALVLLDENGEIIEPATTAWTGLPGYGSYLDDGDDSTIEMDTTL